MRRMDYAGQADDRDRILTDCRIGQVGLIDPEGFPRVIPVNFVWHNGAIYFHGATAGEKFALFGGNPKVTFMAYLEYSSVPSYWRSPEYACPSTIYYQSAQLKGNGMVISDMAEKCLALNKLMEKYQPEGGYKAVTAKDPLYDKALRETAILKVVPQEFSLKSKMGQNLAPEMRMAIIRKLRERGHPLDLLTAREMENTLAEPQA